MKRLALLLVVLAGCGGGDDTIPEELHGIWETSNERYEGRTLVLSKREVRFGADEQTTATHTVLSVEREEEKDRDRLTIAYENDDGQRYTFRLCYNRLRGTLWFAGQDKVVWKKVATLPDETP